MGPKGGVGGGRRGGWGFMMAKIEVGGWEGREGEAQEEKYKETDEMRDKADPKVKGRAHLI